MTVNRILNIFESFRQLKVLVIGDVMVDAYMWGKVDRISPEAPVPIIASTNRENRLGGAANVALNVQALGAKPILGAIIGDDEKGDVFKSLLQKRGLVDHGIFSLDNRVTTVKTRIISDNQHLLRVDEEQTTPLSGHQEDEFSSHLLEIIENDSVDVIIFEDYDKGCITPKVIDSVVSLANKLGIPTLVDPKRRNFMNYNGVSLFKPNFKELVEGLKMDVEKEDKIGLQKALELFLSKTGSSMILTTLSEEGVVASDGKEFVSIPAEIRDITDVSGAGDTVISTAALCLAVKLDMKDIAAISNMAGGLVCEKVGVVPVDKSQLTDEIVRYYDS